MLIEFSVSNYRSIYTRQTLNMVASSDIHDLENQNTFAINEDNKIRLLRSSVLYGANASGKSTLIKALKFMKDCVITSQQNIKDETIEITPFKLNPNARKEDSEFEIIFIENNIRYEYGFKCNSKQFTEEWLFAYPKKRAQKWFHRVLNPETGKDEYKFNQSFNGEKWKEFTKENNLFLSTAIQLNNEKLKPIFEWFQNKLRIIDNPISSRYSELVCTEKEGNKKIVDLMNQFDLSVVDIRIKKGFFDTEYLPKNIPFESENKFIKILNEKEVVTQFIHQDPITKELVSFDENEESDGTRTLFCFSAPLLDAIENNRIFIIDELDTSLHSLIIEQVIKIIHHHKESRAQLIFTTHDSSLFNSFLFRPDQIWFMEKNRKNQESRLYSLFDFDLTNHSFNQRTYLNGRYGGIPFLKDFDFYGTK